MAHIHEKIDFTATVLIVHNNRVLLRKHEKYGIWIGVGGHIELDEDANTTALREVEEEVGLKVTLIPPPHWVSVALNDSKYRELIPPVFMSIHHVSPTHQHHDLVFVAKSETDVVIPEKPTDEWTWCTREDILAHQELESHLREHALYALTMTAH